MPFDSAPAVRELVGNGSANTLNINWIYYSKDHVVVRKRDANGGMSTLTHITDYTLTAANVAAGGTLTLVATPATGEKIYAWIDGVPQTQGRRYSVAGGLPPNLLNEDFDKLVQRTAVLEEKVKRAFRLPFSNHGEDMEGAMELADLLGMMARFNATTGTLEGIALGDLDLDAVALPLSIAQGGTGAATAILARAALGLAIGTDVLAYSTRINNVDQDFVDLASHVSGTTDIGAVASRNVRVTGTNAITGLGTVAAGITRRVRFAGILTLTYHATNLILPTAASITTAANDIAVFVSLGSGAWICTAYQRANGTAVGSGVFPAFRATTATTTSLTQNTYVRIPFATETFDTHGYYASPTFTPLVAGKYLVTAKIASNITKAETLRLAIYKNGSAVSERVVEHTGAGADSDFSIDITDIVDMNGSTDTLEVYVRCSDATPSTLVADANKNQFAACRIA